MNLSDFLYYYDVDVPVEIYSVEGTAFYGYTNDLGIFDTVVGGKKFEDLVVGAFSVTMKNDEPCLLVLIESDADASEVGE